MRNRGGKIFCILWILFLAAGFFVFPKIVLAGKEDLIITEMMANPPSGETEWIELYANKDIDFVRKEGSKTDNKKINNFYICSKKGERGCDTNHVSFIYLPEGSSSVSIKKGEFFIIARDNKLFRKKYGNVEDVVVLKSDSKFNLLKNTDDNAIVAYSYGEEIKWEGEGDYYGENNKIENGYSLEKSNFKKEIFKESCVLGGTPGKENSRSDDKEYSDKIRINELFPAPLSGGKEYIELYNSGKSEDLSCWKIKDKSGKTCSLSGKLLENSFLLLDDCEIKLNNSGGEKVILYNPNDESISSSEYSGSAKDGLSYNFDSTGWQWSRYPTPGENNIFKKNYPKGVYLSEIFPNPKGEDKGNEFIELYNNSSKNIDLEGWIIKDNTKTKGYIFSKNNIIKSQKYLAVYSRDFSFALNNSKGEDVFLLNPNKDKVSKISYEKAAEGLSYNFNENKWQWSRFLTPGKENRFEEKPDIGIVKVTPNPKGKDTKFESIILENKSKKKVNLKGWSVATGWKNLYNHPITKKFVINPGKTKELTRKYSLFTLNNKQSKIELRRSDGTVASKVKYSKKEGIQDGETYEKIGSGWEWIEPSNALDNNDIQEKPTNTTGNVVLENLTGNGEIGIIENKNQDQEGEVAGVITENEFYINDVVPNGYISENSKSKPKKLFLNLFRTVNYFINSIVNLFFAK